MNVEYYKQRLLEKERDLLERMKTAGIEGREAGRLPDDPGSDPLVDALKEVQFAEADSQQKIFKTAPYQSVSTRIDVLLFDYRDTDLYCVTALSYADCPIPRAILGL